MTIPAPWPCCTRRTHAARVLAVMMATLLLSGPIDVAANINPGTTPPPAVCDDYVPVTIIIDAGEVTNSTVVDRSAVGGWG